MSDSVRLVLFTLSETKQIWVTFERTNWIQVTFNCGVNVAFEHFSGEALGVLTALDIVELN